MEEPIDVYSDQFMVTTTAFGANLSFYVNTPHPEQTKPVAAEKLATIRMSIEHLKLMTMIIVKQVKKMESDTGIKIALDKRVLNSIGIPPDDWEEFWKSSDINL
ncbi:MAG: hypothetical protein KAW90_01055 [Dehalococcoidales bacterium]|nr:hypothetical protein [Dehalococcoidales bacterium]